MNKSVDPLYVIFSFAAFMSTLSYQPSIVMAMNDEAKKEVVIDMYEDYKADFKTVADISPLEATALTKNEKVVFVDVRSKEEMSVSMLPGAISQKEYLESRERFRDHTLVAYCTIGYRSGMFAKKMAETTNHSDRIYNLRGGLLAWVLEGGKVYDGKGESRRIHVYGKRWNYPPAGYESIW